MKTKSKILTLVLTLSFIIAMCVALGLVASAAAPGLPAADTAGEVVDVWLIGGQSNAVGFGENYPESGYDKEILDAGVSNVWYFSQGEGAQHRDYGFYPVTLGLGLNPESSGAEIGIATALAGNSSQMNAVIKYSIGATFLYPDVGNVASQNHGTWTPPSYLEKYGISTMGNKTGDMYDNFMRTVEEGIDQIVEAGYTPRIRGMWWMQGEAETWDDTMASAYQELLTTLISDVRNDVSEISGTNCSDMPFVLGRIHYNGTHTGAATLAKVQEAQDAVANDTNLKNVFMVNPATDLKDPATGALATPVQQDVWHYDALAQQMIGEAFVEKATIANTEATPYGLITYDDTTKDYPFAVFFEKKDGTMLFHSLYSNYVDATDHARWMITVRGIAPVITNAEIERAIVYLRSDYVSTSNPTQLANTYYPITFDLNGKTLTAPTLMDTWNNSGTTADSEITYKNGKVLLSKYGAIYIRVLSGIPDNNVTLSVNFEDIYLAFSQGSTSTRLISNDWITYNDTINSNFDFNFNNCTLDFANNLQWNALFADFSNSEVTTDTYKDVTVTFEGCKFLTDSITRLVGTNMREGDAMYFKADSNGSFGTVLLKNAPGSETLSGLVGSSVTTVAPVTTETTEGEFTVYNLVQSGTVEIPGYGTITAQYADANAYPFAIFYEMKDGTFGFKKGSANYLDAMEDARWRALGENADVKRTIVYLRKDFVHTGNCPTQASNTIYPITVDLGGNALTTPRIYNTWNLSASIKESTIEYKNGAILHSGSSGLIYVDLKDNFATENQTTNINFDGIRFGFAESNSASILIADAAEVNKATKNAIFNFNCKNCTIDLITNRTSSYRTIAKMSIDASNVLEDIRISFEGCKFIANSITDLSYIENKTEGDSVVFSETNTNKLLMHPSVAAPDYYNTFDGANGSKLICVETLEREDSYKVYSLERGVDTTYGPVPSVLASNSKYPFLLFTVNSSDKIAFHSVAETYYDAIYNSRMYGDLTGAKEMIVLMTTDFNKSRGDVRQLALSKCDITVDVGGHNLTVGLLMQTWGGTYSRNGVTVNYKNGTILTRGWHLIETDTWAGAPENCVMNINFEKVKAWICLSIKLRCASS